jgi:hypothetical protein
MDSRKGPISTGAQNHPEAEKDKEGACSNPDGSGPSGMEFYTILIEFLDPFILY